MSCIINTFEFTSKAFSASLSAQTLRGDGGACGDRHGLLLVTGTTQLQATTRLCDPRTRTSEAGWLAGWMDFCAHLSLLAGLREQKRSCRPCSGGHHPPVLGTQLRWGRSGASLAGCTLRNLGFMELASKKRQFQAHRSNAIPQHTQK